MSRESTPIIGGKADGTSAWARLPRMSLEDETYMLVSYREGDQTHYFYQLADLKPAEVLAIYRERYVKKA